MTLDHILDDILAREGGYVDNPHDRGGCTNYGITLATLQDWRGKTVTCEDVRALTRLEARSIYRDLYVARPGFDKLPSGPLQALLIDWGVHSGPRAAIRALQRILHITADGVLGPKTLAAASVASPDVARLLLKARGEYIAGILQRDPSQRVFAAGWLRRLLDFL